MTKPKLTIEDALHIRNLLDVGYPIVLICDQYNISRFTVLNIRDCSRHWKCLIPLINVM